jgi:hypothetical protein
MVELTHTAYATLNTKDERYRDNPRNVRADVLKALALINATHNQLYGETYWSPSVVVYKSKNKVTIKCRWPQEYNSGDTVYGILRKDEIYETVLGMVNDEG